MSKKIEKHDSYGLLSIDKITSNQRKNLFGSSIKHENTILMRLHHAKKERHLKHDFYYTDGNLPIIELEMSPLQLANVITGMNIGMGYPVTIKRICDKEIEECPEIKYTEIFEEEFKGNIKAISSKFGKLVKKSNEILGRKGGNIKKVEKEELIQIISSIEQDINDNLPFIQKMFHEQMNKTLTEMKSEIESFLFNAKETLQIPQIKKHKLLTKGE